MPVTFSALSSGLGPQQCDYRPIKLISKIQADPFINKDEFEGKWKQLRGQTQQRWSRLIDDDLARITSQYDQFIDVLQKKYGYTRAVAEEEINRYLAQWEAQPPATVVGSPHKNES